MTWIVGSTLHAQFQAPCESTGRAIAWHSSRVITSGLLSCRATQSWRWTSWTMGTYGTRCRASAEMGRTSSSGTSAASGWPMKSRSACTSYTSFGECRCPDIYLRFKNLYYVRHKNKQILSCSGHAHTVQDRSL